METASAVDSSDEFDDMGKPRPIDQAVVDDWVAKLRGVGISISAFDVALGALKADKRLSVRECSAIAWNYARGGLRPKSKSAAIDKIERRFNELIRDSKNVKIAKSAKPW